jgi:hypothetical protein
VHNISNVLDLSSDKIITENLVNGNGKQNMLKYITTQSQFLLKAYILFMKEDYYMQVKTPMIIFH